MRTSTRLLALSLAVGLGAGPAAACDVHQDITAQPRPVVATSHVAPTTTTTPPRPTPILPFTAKLTSDDIPVAGGGVRSGGCSGSLIAPEWIITAGHCFHDVDENRVGGPPPYHLTVTVGKLTDSDPGGHTVQVVDVRQSPVNDLAVAKLSEPIDDIAPLTLADSAPTVGQQLQFAGWGSLSATVVVPSDHLKRGLFSVETIGPVTLELDPVVPRTVENSPCPDDSGAPYFVSGDDRTGVLFAVENNGPSCPEPGEETVARVDVVAGWIHQQIDSSTP